MPANWNTRQPTSDELDQYPGLVAVSTTPAPVTCDEGFAGSIDAWNADEANSAYTGDFGDLFWSKSCGRWLLFTAVENSDLVSGDPLANLITAVEDSACP